MWDKHPINVGFYPNCLSKCSRPSLGPKTRIWSDRVLDPFLATCSLLRVATSCKIWITNLVRRLDFIYPWVSMVYISMVYIPWLHVVAICCYVALWHIMAHHGTSHPRDSPMTSTDVPPHFVICLATSRSPLEGGRRIWVALVKYNHDATDTVIPVSSN